MSDSGVADLICLLPHNPVRVFVAAEVGKFQMSQVPVWRPLMKFDLRDEQRL